MKRKMMVFDKSREAGEALAGEIRGCHKWLAGAEFCFYDPMDVFTRPLPESPKAVFFVVSDMYEAEAMRKLHELRPDVTVVIVCDGGGDEFGIWSWRVGARYYLRRPVDKNELLRVLKKCGMDMPFEATYISGRKQA